MVELASVSVEAAVPPHSFETEEAILGGILFDPHAIERVAPLITAEDFYVPAHQLIYQAVTAAYNQKKSTDLTLVVDWLTSRGLIEKTGGASYLSRLMESVYGAVNIDVHAQFLSALKTRRQTIKAGDALVKLGHNSEMQLHQVLDEAEQKICALRPNQQQDGLQSILSPLVDIYGQVEQRFEDGVFPGLTSGFTELDVLTGGFNRKDFIVIGGRPSMGKTAFTLQVGYKIAMCYKQPVAVFSLEMSKKQIVHRLITGECGIESNRLNSGRIADYEWDFLQAAIDKVASVPLFIDDSPMISVRDIRSRCRQLSRQHGGLGAVMIDYIQLLSMPQGDKRDRVQAISYISRALRGLAKELDVPIFGLSQLSRAVEDRADKRPVSSDLRESGSLEQDADLVIMLYRDEYYNPGSEDRGVAEVIVTKHRNGPTGMVKLQFEPSLTQFKDLHKIKRNSF